MKVALLGPASPRAVDVTLFATLDSGTAARVDGVCPHPYNDDDALDGRAWEALHIACCFERSPSTARRYARPPRALSPPTAWWTSTCASTTRCCSHTLPLRDGLL
jgi:hypothetical protein